MKSISLKSLLFIEKLSGLALKVLPHPKIIFLHIPKCGGTSIASSISTSIYAGSDGFIDPIHTRDFASKLLSLDQVEGTELLFNIRRTLFLDYHRKGIRYIYGHFPVVKQCLLNPKDYIFLTISRNPVDRFISQFSYFLATRYFTHNKKVTLEDIEALWDNYLDSYLSKFHANTLSAYLDQQSLSNLGEPDSIIRAAENLSYFQVVGFLEDLPLFSQQFADKTGRKLNIGLLKNKTSDRFDRDKYDLVKAFFTESRRNQVTDLCSSDIELYNLAKQKFYSN